MVFTNPASANDERTFEGTLAEWNALTLVQKTFYTKAIINNDYTDNPVGNLNALTTTDKSSCVPIGNLNALTTTDKSSCVGAINEVNSAKAKKYTYYTSATGVNSIDLTQISFDELKIVVIAPLTGYSCVFELHVFKTDLSSTYLFYSTGNNTSMIKVGIMQSLCIFLEFLFYLLLFLNVHLFFLLLDFFVDFEVLMLEHCSLFIKNNLIKILINKYLYNLI